MGWMRWVGWFGWVRWVVEGTRGKPNLTPFRLRLERLRDPVASRVVVSGNFPLGLQGRRHSEQDQQYGEQTHGNLDFNQGEMCNLTPSGPNSTGPSTTRAQPRYRLGRGCGVWSARGL